MASFNKYFSILYHEKILFVFCEMSRVVSTPFSRIKVNIKETIGVNTFVWDYLIKLLECLNMQRKKKFVLFSQKYWPKTTFPSFNHPYLLKYTNNHWKDCIFGISINFWVRLSKKNFEKMALFTAPYGAIKAICGVPL